MTKLLILLTNFIRRLSCYANHPRATKKELIIRDEVLRRKTNLVRKSERKNRTNSDSGGVNTEEVT